MKEKKTLLHIGKAYVQMALGCLIAGVSFAQFFVPNDIAPGGVTGIATLIAAVAGGPVGLISAVLNVPLFLIGYRAVGRRFVFRSFVAMLALSFCIDLLPQRAVTQDMMLASLYGGILLGVGLGLVLRGGATTGGTDLAAQLVHNRFPVITVGTFLFGIDCAVVLVSGLVFDAQSALWALIALFISTKVMDMVLQGWNTAHQFFIISDRAEEIARRINTEMDRGATLLSAYGSYSGAQKGMVFCVINKNEMTQLRQIIADEDERAFVTVSEVHEAMGEGFAGLKK